MAAPRIVPDALTWGQMPPERVRRGLPGGVVWFGADARPEEVTVSEPLPVTEVLEASPEPAGVPATNGKTGRGCRGCGAALPGDPRQLWCSPSCRKRTGRRLAKKALVAPRSRPTRPLAPAAPVAPQADVFSQLIAVAQGLPAGVQVDELSPAGFTLRWAP